MRMTDAGYVVAGWVLTAVVLAGYWASIARRTRRRGAACRRRARSAGREPRP